MWIGILWYFNFVQIPNMPKIPDEQKPAIGKVIAPAALFWFRWGAMGTLITGLILAMLNKYLFYALPLGFVEGATLGHAMIGIGMWLGIIMWANVWFIIWPAQQKALGLVEADDATKAAMARRAMLGSRTNTLLSVPMLFRHGLGAEPVSTYPEPERLVLRKTGPSGPVFVGAANVAPKKNTNTIQALGKPSCLSQRPIHPLIFFMRRHVESALMGKAGVGQECDIRDGHSVAHEPLSMAERQLHEIERRLAAFDPLRLPLVLPTLQVDHMEAAHGDIWLMTVLLPEQPFVDLGLRERIIRKQRTAPSEIADDRVRLRQATPVIELDYRHLTLGISRKKTPMYGFPRS